VAGGVTAGLRFATTETPVGELTIVRSDEGIVATADDPGELDAIERAYGAPARRSAKALSAAVRELDAYFAGRSTRFATPVDLTLVAGGFSRRVLEATMRIPYGELRTYGDVADAAGVRRAGRAAGGALSRCPIEIFVPCHRVVPVGRGLGGYGAHADRKAYLVRLEGGDGP
jgi:methylated-DNA-[protein]-cysteine S-methyltransferase